MAVQIPDGCVEPCKGCSHRNRSAQESEREKQEWLEWKLRPWGRQIESLRGVGPKDRWHYRQKVCLAADFQEDGWKFGMRSRDEIIPIPSCPIQADSVNQIASLLGNSLPPPEEFPMVYFMQSGRQVALVLKSHALPRSTWLNSELKRDLKSLGVNGLWINRNPVAGHRVLSHRGWHLVWGEARSRIDSGLLYGPASFQQLIPQLYEEAMHQAQKHLRPGPKSLMVDLYCGIGVSLRRWQQANCSCIGVELSGEAVECARRNAPQATVLQGKCDQRLPQINHWIQQNVSYAPCKLLFANPPRVGLDSRTLEWIAQSLQPHRIAYLSCSAGTLSRDLDYLKDHNYQVLRIRPYDFFPNTHHVEALALLQRADSPLR